MNRKASSTRDDFSYWLMDMDDALDRFKAQFPKQMSKQLDFSPASLDVLEASILDRYPDIKATRPLDQSQWVNGAACYIGETYRKALGGVWDINLDEPEYAFFGIPILKTGSREKVLSIHCPLSLATASTDRRTGTYLRTVLENMIERQKNTD